MFKFKRNALLCASMGTVWAQLGTNSDGAWSIQQCNNPDTGAPEMMAAFERSYYEDNVADLELGFVYNSQGSFKSNFSTTSNFSDSTVVSQQ